MSLGVFFVVISGKKLLVGFDSLLVGDFRFLFLTKSVVR
jgi:hypothetical protein